MFHSSSLSSFAKIGIIGISLTCILGAYANVDMGTEQQDCTLKKDFVQPVTNGSCYGIIIGHGTETFTLRGDGETVAHKYSQGCVVTAEGWHEDNPEWESKTCAPTYACLDNPAVDLANASYISAHEQPYENAPDVLAPIFPLAKDYLKDIVFADNTAVSDTEDGCQYTCNDGYRVSTGNCGGGNASQATATITGTTLPLTTDLKATITSGGSGYTTAPTVTLTGCPNTVTATATVTGGVVTGITFGGTGICTSNTHTVTLAAPGGTGNTTAAVTVTGTTIPATTAMKVTLTSGGSGYTTAPTVTLTGCPNTVTATATVTGGVVTGITFGGTGTCTTPAIIIAAPPVTTTSTGTAGYSCTVAPTLTVAAPTGSLTGSAATLKLSTDRQDVLVDTGGSGYTASPQVTVVVPSAGTCTPYTPAVGTTLTNGVVTAADFKVATPVSTVNRATFDNNKLIFGVTSPGAGYTAANPPVVKVSIGTGAGCTNLPAVPNLNNRGELETIDDLVIPPTCTGTPTVTITAPPALVTVTCPTGTTFTVAAPTGTVTPVTATATVANDGTITITNPGSGYTTNPTVTVTGGTCTAQPVATATIDVATKQVKTITFSATGGGTTATAISNATGTVATIPTNGGGSGYTSAPAVTVTGGTCTTLPTATATVANGVVTGVTLANAVGCTVAPILTIAPPGGTCAGTGTVKKCIPLVCTGTSPTTAIYCENDTVIAGHEDQPKVHRSDATQCTTNAKCEWFCPAETPFYCEAQNTCVATQNDCGTIPNTCKTSAPSELKTEVDYPLIQCDAIDQTNTHFRYKVTKTGGTTTDTYISPLYTVGTSIKHPTTLHAGSYTVTCLYGTAANTNQTSTDFDMTAGTCTKTMTVNDTANGCSRIYPYRGATLSDEMSSPSAFDASFRCGSRQAVNNVIDTKAYRLQVGTGDAAYLAFDRNISDLFAGLAIGPVSTQTQNYNFSTGALVSCATKVGDGYSTNNSCHITTCVGGNCANPQTFIIVPSDEITCTNQDSISYDVGCNPSSPDYNACLQFLYEGTGANGNTTYTRNVKIKVNGVEQDRYFTCKTETPPGALGPVKTCTISLQNGTEPVTIFAGDAQGTNNYSFQTTAYTLKKDTGKPVGTIAYYTNYSNGVTLSQDQYEYWQRQPITAVITCTDKTSTNQPGEQDGSGCACSNTLTADTITAATQAEIDQWSLGIPSSNTNIGPDIMTYSRVITNNNGALASVKVQDSANNKSDQAFTPDFGIDSMPPRLTASKTGNSITLSFVDNGSEDSGVWKFSDNIPVPTATSPQIYKGGANNAILYRKGPKAQVASIEFGADCSPLPVKNTNYYKYKEVPSAPTTQTLTVPNTTITSFDPNNEVVAYCIQDNAGNINRGYFPNNVTGCFASSNMATVPTLSPSTLTTHYAPLLKTRLTSTLSNNEKYGFSFSENTLNASCFRGILSNNVTTLVANQLTPRTTLTLTNWDTDRAVLKNTSTLNTNGYYFYSYTSNTANTLTLGTAPTGTGTKSVIVEGGNIQINSNIEYTGTGKTLLLVARKNSAGQGGNIYINPSVTRVDAIIIADGGSVMNGTTSSGVATTRNWITHPTELTNRLTINGRIYSYNTRGGSVTPQAAPGTDFDPITGNTGKLFDGSTFNGSASPTQAATYDLERLRVMLSDGNSQCTTHVNYQVFTGTNLPALLIKPNGFTGGSCSF